MFSLIAIASILGVVAAAPSDLGLGIGAVTSQEAIPNYGFNYAVNDPLTGDNKAQTESRTGGVVKGSYSLREPDGTLRVVEYAADPVSGFNAVVKRIGAAAHPQTLVATPIVSKQIVAPVAEVPISSSLAGLGGLGLEGFGLNSLGLGLGSTGLGYGLGNLGDAGYGLGYGGLIGKH